MSAQVSASACRCWRSNSHIRSQSAGPVDQGAQVGPREANVSQLIVAEAQQGFQVFAGAPVFQLALQGAQQAMGRTGLSFVENVITHRNTYCINCI